MSDSVFIYALKDPRTKAFRYIGKTEDLAHRLGQHLSDSLRCHRTNWIKSLKAQNLVPEIVALSEVPKNNWQFWEREYIKLFRELGCSLTNSTDGGEGAVDSTGEIARKISAAQKGKKETPEAVEANRRCHIGIKMPPKTPEQRAAISARRRGKKLGPASSETRALLSRIRMGEGNSFYGKHHTAEALEKNRKAHLGRKASAETLARMSEAQKKRWAKTKSKNEN